VSGRDAVKTRFLLIVAFTATPLGYYSFNCSSEVLSFGCLALVSFWLWARARPDWIDALGVGTLAACLVLTRPHLAVYVPLIVGVFSWRLWTGDPRPGPKKWLGHGSLLTLPVALALTQILWVNRWMTGSVLGSTYSFGNAYFRSLNLADPEPLAVLLHPWHGLLVYHPFYALGIGLAVLGIFRGSRAERALHLGITTTLAIHLYLQAAWYCWWLGMWSLGNRGFGVAAVLLVPVVARALRRATPAWRLALLGALVVCSLWSLLLMVQGNTNFMRWSELATAQAETAMRTAFLLPWALILAFAANAVARRQGPVDRLTTAGSALLLALILDHLAQLLFEAASGQNEGWRLALRVGLVALAPLVALGQWPSSGVERFPGAGWLRPLGALGSVLLFACVGLLFAHLARGAEGLIADGGIPGDGPVRTFHVLEVEECYREYLRVPGFVEKKDSLRRFLAEHRPD
jgi:hypothetical protein